MRATGKTFRAVLRALADASEGKNVVFVTKYPRDNEVLYFIKAAVDPLHECACFSPATQTLEFRKPPAGREVIGSLKLTDIKTFEHNVRENRYRGYDKRKFKVVFDDCGPDEYTAEYLAVYANG